MKTIAFYTLGCKLNFSETSTLSRQFEQKGYHKVAFEKGADIYVINTCSVTDHADKKCRKVVKEALKHNPNAFIAIVGCYAQLKPHEIASIPGVDTVLGANEKFRMLELVDTFEKKAAPVVHHSPIETAVDFYCSYSVNDRTRTFLKVQDGCDYSCAFCTIPLARGNSRSDSIHNVVTKANELSEAGVKEIVLTGVNIGDFGLQQGQRKEHFIDLIAALDANTGIQRYRISSIEPNLLTDEIISFVAQSRAFVPHFHIPLQSGSDEMLKLMRRRYKTALYSERIAQIRALMPNACIGVDVITGHPGETEDLFNETFAYLNNLDISYLHVFTYSERANTHALSIGGVVPAKQRELRTTQLRTLSEKKRRAFYESQIGSTQEVLFEADVSEGYMYGFTKNYIKVRTPYDPLMVNETRLVTLEQINAEGTVEVVDDVFAPLG